MAKPLNAQGDVWITATGISEGSFPPELSRCYATQGLNGQAHVEVHLNLTGYIRYVVDQERPA